jgi:RNA polymerase primary sigma factor
MDAPFQDGDNDNCMMDVMASDSPSTDNEMDKESLRIELERSLKKILTEKEIQVIKMSFGIGMPERSLEEIGAHFDLTRERVRQIKEKSLKKLREDVNSSILKKFLG